MKLTPENEARLERIQLEMHAKRAEVLFHGPSPELIALWNSTIDNAISRCYRQEDVDFFKTLYIRYEDLEE